MTCIFVRFEIIVAGGFVLIILTGWEKNMIERTHGNILSYLGGLEWGRVKPMIEAALSEIPEVHVKLYEPKT